MVLYCCSVTVIICFLELSFRLHVKHCLLKPLSVTSISIVVVWIFRVGCLNSVLLGKLFVLPLCFQSVKNRVFWSALRMEFFTVVTVSFGILDTHYFYCWIWLELPRCSLRVKLALYLQCFSVFFWFFMMSIKTEASRNLWCFTWHMHKWPMLC